jgi:hypothetical protein
MSPRKYISGALTIGLLLLLFSACAQEIESTGPGSPDPMLKELSEIKGKYTWDKELNRYIYSDKQRIEAILSTRDTELALKTLVGCLDNFELSNSVIQDKRVVLGIICYEAISQTAYYESTAQDGDVAKNWSGHILPTATPDELREAKKAWENVIASKTYILF